VSETLGLFGLTWHVDSVPCNGDKVVLHLADDNNEIVLASACSDGWLLDQGGTIEAGDTDVDYASVRWVHRADFPFERLSREQLLSLIEYHACTAVLCE
jgi:hypothetical protein